MLEELEKIAKHVESKTKIPTYPKSIEMILLALTKTNDFWLVVRYSGEPLNLVAETIKELKDLGFVDIRENKIFLTDKGRDLISTYGIGFGNHTCPTCNGRTIILERLGSDVIKEFQKIHSERPSAIQEYDQGYVTPEVTLARVAFMDQRGDLRGRKIIILGDDDLVSVAIGLTHFAKEIAVIEIDERLTGFIEKIANDYGLDIVTHTKDLREPLPDELVGRFDTFQTDPPETLKALKLFIGRGISALRGEKCAGYFGLTRIDASLDKWREFQRLLVNEFNVVITDVLKDFNEYIDWEYLDQCYGWKVAPVKAKPSAIWFVSTLYRIETLRGFKGFNESMHGEDIYYDEELASA